MKLIIGLGNPGKQYLRTRHNVGFAFLDRLAGNENFTIDKKHSAEVLKTTLHNKRVLLVKPMTFMNNSGVAVAALLHFYQLPTTDLIIIHDDKDIPLGEYRIQKDRGAAGHNGVLSIIEHLGTKDFTRVRVGVAPAPNQPIADTANFVLGRFTAAEQKELQKVFLNVHRELETLLTTKKQAL